MTRRIFFKRLAVAIVLVLMVSVLLIWSYRPDVPDFSQYPAGPQRKDVFFNYFLPLVEQSNQEILQTRQQLQAWSRNIRGIGWWDSGTVEDMAQDYRIDSFNIESEADWHTLLKRVDVVPASLALAQAASESAWGTSRFAREGNNFYGQWCFEQGCGMVPGSRDSGKLHEVKVFDSPQASVESYIRNINSHNAYQSLREIRARLRAADTAVIGIALAGGLEKYSERGADYIAELQAIIRHNDLARYDQ